MKKLFALLVFSLFASSLHAGEIDRAIAATSGFRASFVQKFTPKGFTREQAERGTVTFGPAPKMRWSYDAPEKKVFVFDGTTSWLYSPGDQQVTVSRVNDRQREALPFLLLADPAAMSRSFKVSERVSGDSVISTITPKSSASPIRQVIVTSGQSDHLLRRLEYSDRQGNRTVFEFAGFQKAATNDAFFRFAAPPGTEVIEN